MSHLAMMTTAGCCAIVEARVKVGGMTCSSIQQRRGCCYKDSAMALFPHFLLPPCRTSRIRVAMNKDLVVRQKCESLWITDAFRRCLTVDIRPGGPRPCVPTKIFMQGLTTCSSVYV